MGLLCWGRWGVGMRVRSLLIEARVRLVLQRRTRSRHRRLKRCLPSLHPPRFSLPRGYQQRVACKTIPALGFPAPVLFVCPARRLLASAFRNRVFGSA